MFNNFKKQKLNKRDYLTRNPTTFLSHKFPEVESAKDVSKNRRRSTIFNAANLHSLLLQKPKKANNSA